MEIDVDGPMSSQKNSKYSVGKLYSYSTKWEKNIVETLHIYGASAFSVLFCDNQDTESESCEI